MTQQMKVKAKFDNFANLDQPTKSLINFFMKDALLYVYGNYVNNAYNYTKTDDISMYIEAQQTGEVGNTYSLEFIRNENDDAIIVTFKISGETICSGETSLDSEDYLYGYDIEAVGENDHIGDYVHVFSEFPNTTDESGWINGSEIPAYGNNPLVFTLSHGGFDGMYTNILPKYRLAQQRLAEELSNAGISTDLYNIFSLIVPYSNNASAGNTSDVTLYDYNSSIPAYKNILTRVESNLYIMNSQWTYSDYSNTYDNAISLSNQIANVTIEPYIGDTINTDASVKPTGLSDNETSSINNITFSSQPRNIDYDFQLRTSTFSLHTYNSETHESTNRPVYYKIGIYPLGNNTVDIVKASLTNNSKWFVLNHDWRGVLFNIVNYGDTLEIDEYEDNNSYAVTKSADITEFGLGGCLDIANRFIMPASNCLLYFELYNEDNTLCNLDTLNNTLAYYGENGSAWEAPTFAGQDINMLGLNIIELTNENDGTRIPVDSINFDE